MFLQFVSSSSLDKARTKGTRKTVYAGIDLSVTLTCEWDAYPPVTDIDWRKNGRSIASSTKVRSLQDILRACV